MAHLLQILNWRGALNEIRLTENYFVLINSRKIDDLNIVFNIKMLLLEYLHLF